MKLRAKCLATCLAACIAACTTSSPPAGKPLQIVALDVDGGAATLYVTPEGKSLLIDAGWPAGMGGRRRPAPPPSSAERIVTAARQAGLTQLDYVLVTHYHIDHVGGFGELLERFPVGTILDHGPNREPLPPGADAATVAREPATLYPLYEKLVAGRTRRTLQVGDRIHIGSMVLTTVTSDRQVPARPASGAVKSTPHCAGMPPVDDDGGEENPRSVGVSISYGAARVVSLGDLTWNVEKTLVCPDSRIGRADLFFVSNHGSNLNNSPALLHALAPRVAIMNNGARKGGDPETYDRLMAAPGLQRLWLLHFGTKGGAARNPAEDYIANVTDEPDQRAPLHVSVFPDGRMTVRNGRNGFTESYPATVR